MHFFIIDYKIIYYEMVGGLLYTFGLDVILE